MFIRLVYESFRRQRRRKFLAGAAVAMGMAVTTAMLAVATDIGDKMARELRTYGANLVVYPQEDTLDVEIGGVSLKPVSEGGFLNEADLPKIKGIFWRHNIVGFAPFLPLSASLLADEHSDAVPVQVLGTYFAKSLELGGESFVAGVRSTHPWWKVSGSWPADNAREVLLGKTLAGQLGLTEGTTVTVSGRAARVTGVLSTGGPEDSAVVAPLFLAQEIAQRPGAVRRIYVSALTKPEDAFARRDPASMTPADRDRWYCSPYALSIAYQLRETIPHAEAEQIRQVAQNEGTVLSRIEGLMLLVAVAALLAAGLAVSAAMSSAVLQRRHEVGIMKALGASNAAVASIFYVEAVLIAILGGTVGFGLGSLLGQQIGARIFGSSIEVAPVLLPLVLGLSVTVTLASSASSVWNATRYEPADVLRGTA